MADYRRLGIDPYQFRPVPADLVDQGVRMRLLFAALTIIAALASAGPRASAHSFNVALLIAVSEPSGAKREQVRDGFLLATKERDSHPDETSDGHLGGLDVHLYLADGADNSRAEIEALLKRHAIDIVVAIGRPELMESIQRLAENSHAILITPGLEPIPDPGRAGHNNRPPALRAFLAAFEKEYGHQASACAALGYNAARRIDAAIRPLGGILDKTALRRALGEPQPAFDC